MSYEDDIEPAWEPGDIVVLKSGSPPMVVAAVAKADDGSAAYFVHWLNVDFNLQAAHLPACVLTEPHACDGGCGEEEWDDGEGE